MNLFPIETLVKLAGAVAISIVLYMGYSYIKHIGYKEAEVVYQQKIQEYQNTVLNKINTIESLSNTLATESKASNEAVAKDIEDILKKVKGKPLVVIKDGECIPSKTFSDSISEINKRANQSIQGVSK